MIDPSQINVIPVHGEVTVNGVHVHPYGVVTLDDDDKVEGEDNMMIVLPMEGTPGKSKGHMDRIHVESARGQIRWVDAQGERHQIGEPDFPVVSSIQNAIRSGAGALVMFIDKSNGLPLDYAIFEG